MFLTDAELTQAMKDVRSSAPDTFLLPYWNTIITASNIKAYFTIVNALMLRGWLKSVIDQWDRGAEFQRSLGMWEAIQEVSAMAPDAYSHVSLKSLDRSEELKTVMLSIGGLWQDATEIYGQPQTGPGSLSGSVCPETFNDGCGCHGRASWWDS